MKKFWKVFGITVAVLLAIILLIAAYFWFSYNAFSSNVQIENLDTYESGRRNVLIVGTDESGLRSDVMMIASFSDSGESVNLMSIPRDTRAVVNGRVMKVNSALAVNGDEGAIQAAKNLTGIAIHDYIKVDFEAVKIIVDKLGGVKFDVPQDMDYEDPYQNLYIHLKAGEQRLNGDEAVQLLRFRGYPMADIRRTEVQRDFLKAAFQQKAKVGNVIKLPGILNAVSDHITTSISSKKAMEYVRLVKIKGADGLQTIEIPHTLRSPYVIVNSGEMEQLAESSFR